MRRVVPAAVVAAIVTALTLGLAAGGPERSACGDVGDRERVASPHGKRIAFIRCSADGSAWLYVRDGGRDRRLVPASYGCCYRPSAAVVFRDPAWSPDGRRIAVVIEDTGGTDVWTIGADGRAARRVTSGPARERSPRWSADGSRVSVETETGGTASIRVSP
jgi:Tol biopolymer transport system component